MTNQNKSHSVQNPKTLSDTDLALKTKSLSSQEQAPLFHQNIKNYDKKTFFVSFEADEETMKLFERLKDLKGNQPKAELIKFCFQMTLNQIDPLRKKSKPRKSINEETKVRENPQIGMSLISENTHLNKSLNSHTVKNSIKPTPSERYIPL